MSTTRKIAVWVKPHPDGHFCPTSRLHPDYAEKPDGTLIIGKAFTEEEVRAFINDLKDQTMSLAVEQSIDRIAAKHGIKL